MGGPDNIFQWLRNGESLSEELESNITINSVNATVDGGTYTCTVSNSAGEGSANATLLVNPFVITQPSDIIAENSSFENLRFVVEAYPSAMYLWEFLDGELASSTTGLFTSILEFNPVTFGSEGRYRCTASANGESVTSTVITLTGNTSKTLR